LHRADKASSRTHSWPGLSRPSVAAVPRLMAGTSPAITMKVSAATTGLVMTDTCYAVAMSGVAALATGLAYEVVILPCIPAERCDSRVSYLHAGRRLTVCGGRCSFCEIGDQVSHCEGISNE
jgi:hypothetical protein